MASLAGVKSASGTLVASTVDTVTLSIPYNVVTVVNESSTGVINFTVDGTTPATDGFVVGPNTSVTVSVPLRQQGETAQVNGLAVPTRQDTVSMVTGSPIITDASIVTADLGKQVWAVLGSAGYTGIPGVPAYVGTVNNGVSFVLSSTQSSVTPLPAVATGSFPIQISTVTVALSGSVFVRGVDGPNILTQPAATTNTVVKLISAGTPTYSVVGG